MSEPITDQQRADLGTAGKLFTVELFFCRKHEAKRFCIYNYTTQELARFRRQVFVEGFYFPLDAGHGLIVSPADISEVHVWRQDSYYTPQQQSIDAAKKSQ